MSITIINVNDQPNSANKMEFMLDSAEDILRGKKLEDILMMQQLKTSSSKT